MTSKKEQVSARVDPEVAEVIQHVAQFERRPVSAVVRNVLEDWAKAQQSNQIGTAHA